MQWPQCGVQKKDNLKTFKQTQINSHQIVKIANLLMRASEYEIFFTSHIYCFLQPAPIKGQYVFFNHICWTVITNVKQDGAHDNVRRSFPEDWRLQRLYIDVNDFWQAWIYWFKVWRTFKLHDKLPLVLVLYYIYKETETLLFNIWLLWTEHLWWDIVMII